MLDDRAQPVGAGEETTMAMMVPQQNRGQIVEVGYAATPYGIVRRSYDRSDMSEMWSLAPYAEEDTETAIQAAEWCPDARDYRPISAERAARLLSDED